MFVVAFVVEKGCWKRSVTLVEGRFGFDLLVCLSCVEIDEDEGSLVISITCLW